MAWTPTNPWVIGEPTKKSNFDKMWNNAQHLYDNTLKSNLLDLVHPSVSGGWKGIIRDAGWRPPINQQNGSHLNMLPDGSWGDTATMCLDFVGLISLGHTASCTYRSMGFKVSKTGTYQGFYVWVYKTGNPTDNMTGFIYSDSGGSPNALITNGTATPINGTIITSNSSQWALYEFILSTAPTLTANTQYHFVFSRSGAVDASNYYNILGSNNRKYPHGNMATGTGTPVWTTETSYALCFMLKPTSSYQFLQTGGQFDAKLVGNSNPLPINQADYLWRPMKEFFDPKEGTILIRGSSWTKDRTIADFTYGLDHDRIVIRANATTGYAQVNLYNTSGTKYTVTGTTDVSASYNDIAVKYRLKNDGSDYLYLYVNGSSQGTPLTSQSFNMDVNFTELGTATLMGGFGLAPTWTNTYNCSTLPSAATPAWTYAGTATEAAHAVVNGGKLYIQIVGATDSCYWSIAPSFNNTNGWFITWKNKIGKASDVVNEPEAAFQLFDGTKRVIVMFHTYYLEFNDTGHKVQIDMTKEHVFSVEGKGSDFKMYCDGRLIVDGTGLMGSSADTNIYFGDCDATSGSNAEMIVDYIKWYNTSSINQEFTGGSLSEFACWSGDQSALLTPLYNSGSPISVEEYCGVGDYVRRVFRTEKREGITYGPSISSVTWTPLADMEGYFYIDKARITFTDTQFVNTSGYNGYNRVRIDGTALLPISTVNVNYGTAAIDLIAEVPFGLHKAEIAWCVDTGKVNTSFGQYRSFTIQEVE